MSKFSNARINGLSPYVPGEQPKEREYIKLNTNESPYPPSPLAIEYANKQAKLSYLYPDPDVKELTEAVAKNLGVDKEQVIMTNGSDEVLNFAFMAYCDENTPAVFADITYGFYKVFADINGVKSKIIPLSDDFTLSVDDYIKEKGTVFIANPNAPTGIAIGLNDIERLLKSNPNRIVVIDQAYVDFGNESAVKLVNKYDNLLVTETFSKSRSLAGGRLGYGIASKEIIQDLMRIKYSTNPYNVNRMTAGAGLGAILDKEYFNDNCKKIIDEREDLKSELKRLGFTMTDSKTNFVFVKHEKISGKNLYLQLKNRGILVRHFDSDKIKDYNRITIGNRAQMKALIDAITEILEEIK